MILTIRTDKPEAELGLFRQDGTELAYEKWQAHRELSETIHKQIKKILFVTNSAMDALTGVIYYEGPGSYTGLRIGAAVSNALARGLGIPVVSVGGEQWRSNGLEKLITGLNNGAKPFYEEDAKTTVQKK